MQNKLTILFTFAIFVLVVGWANTSAQAHHCKGSHKNAPECNGGGGGGGGGGGESAEYSVTISGAVLGQSVEPWSAGNRHNIGFEGPHVSLGEFTNLGYFVDQFTLGVNCFGTQPSNTPLYAAEIKRGRHGRAEGHFWFWGQTDNGVPDDPVTLLYQIYFIGTFDDPNNEPWPPPSGGNPTSMTIID